MKLNRHLDQFYKSSDPLYNVDYMIDFSSMDMNLNRRIMYQNSRPFVKGGMLNLPIFMRQKTKKKSGFMKELLEMFK